MSIEKFLQEHCQPGDRVVTGDKVYVALIPSYEQTRLRLYANQDSLEVDDPRDMRKLKAPEVWRRSPNWVEHEAGGKSWREETWERIAVYEEEKEKKDIPSHAYLYEFYLTHVSEVSKLQRLVQYNPKFFQLLLGESLLGTAREYLEKQIVKEVKI